MLTEQMPHCVCGAHAYKPGGGSFGGINQQWFKCQACEKAAMLIDGFGVGYHVFFSAEDAELSEKDFEYINGPLFAAWRTHERKCKKLESKLYEERRLAHVHVVEDEGLDPETCRSFHYLPKEVQERITPLRDQLRLDAWKTITPPLPPQLPESIRVKQRNREGIWSEIQHKDCKEIPIPRDPIRVAHEEYWGGIFAELEKKFGPIERQEIQNGYYSDKNKNEPWYAFRLNGLRMRAGPRKRVDSIHVEGDNPFPCAKIAKIAKEDGVTFYGNGSWQAQVEEGTSICVHAWGKEKTVEYLTTIIEETR